MNGRRLIKVNQDYLICLIITLSLAVCSVLLVKSNVIAVIVLISTAYLIHRPEYLVPQMFVTFLFPDSCMVFSISAQRFYTLTFLAVMWIHLTKSRSSKISSRIQLILLLLIVYLFLETVRLDSINVDFIILFMNVLVAYFMGFLNKHYVKDVMLIMLYACFLIGLTLLYNYLFKAAVDEITAAILLMADTNENRVGMALQQVGAGIFSMGVIYHISKNKKMTYLCFIATLIIFILLLADGSRSALAGLVGACGIGVVYFVRGRDKNMVKRFLRFSVIVILLLAAFVCFAIFIGANGDIAYRYDFKLLITSGGTHRFEIWRTLWNSVMMEYPLFGVGFSGQEIIRILSESGVGFSGTHNLMLDILFKLGLVGEVVFIVLFGSVYLKERKALIQGNYNMLLPMLLFVGFIFNGIGENVFYERALWLAIGICLWMSRREPEYFMKRPVTAYEIG